MLYPHTPQIMSKTQMLGPVNERCFLSKTVFHKMVPLIYFNNFITLIVVKNHVQNIFVQHCLQKLLFLFISRCSQVVSIGQELIMADGSIDYRDMYDYLHLTWQGYRKVSEPVYELLTQIIMDERDSSLINDSSLNSPSVENPASVAE